MARQSTCTIGKVGLGSGVPAACSATAYSAAAAIEEAVTPSMSFTPAKRQYWNDSRNGTPAISSASPPQAIAQAGPIGSPAGSDSQRASGTAAAASRKSSPAFIPIRSMARRCDMPPPIDQPGRRR